MNHSNMFRVVVATLSIAGTMSSALPAQQVTRTVRVWAPPLQLVQTRATVLAWTDSTLEVRLLRAPFDSIAIPFGSLTRLERFHGKSRGPSIALGVVAGGVLGTLVGVTMGESATANCEEFLCELEGLNYAMGGLLIGGIVGGLIGNSAAPERWQEMKLDRVRPKVIAQRHGFGLALTVRF